MNEYYIIQTKIINNNKKLNYYVSIIYDKNNSISIKLCNYKSYPCIEVLIDQNSEIAILQNISNDIKCTINDSNIDNHNIILLIKISLHFIISKFHYVNKFILTDNSTINCSEKINISLADLSFIKYGKTWYEKNFNAIPDDSNINTIDIQKNMIYNRLNGKINMNLEKFISVNKEYLKKNKIDEYKIDKIIKSITKLYNDNISIYSYLEKYITEHMECLYYAYILNNNINKLLYGTTWIIKKEDIISYSIKYSFLPTIKKITHQKIINFIKNFNKNNLEEILTYNYIKKAKNINYII